MLVETIYQTNCPHCGALNYAMVGDMNNLHCPDLDGVVCHACARKYMFYDLDEEMLAALTETTGDISAFEPRYGEGVPCLGSVPLTRKQTDKQKAQAKIKQKRKEKQKKS